MLVFLKVFWLFLLGTEIFTEGVWSKPLNLLIDLEDGRYCKKVYLKQIVFITYSKAETYEHSFSG